MNKINIHEAKTQFSRLLARVAGGEEIVIAKAGKPVARLVPWDNEMKNRIPGLDKGLLTVPEDFNAPLPDDIMESFES